MSRPTLLRRAAIAGGLLAGLAVPSAALAADPSSQAVVLTADDKISTFETAHPEEATTPVAVTGLTAGDTLVGIDVRPQNGQLYALGRNASAGTVQLYALSRRTAFAAPVGARQTLGGTATDTQFGFDFNPVADRIRVVSTAGLNARLDPNTGTATTDTAIPAATKIDGAAYTDNHQNATKTTLYTLSAADKKLYVQNGTDPVGPNGGTQTLGKSVTLNGSAVDFGSAGGFDIAPGVDAPKANDPVASGVGYAAVKAGGQNVLAKIDLTTGAVSGAGPIGPGSVDVKGLAIEQEPVAGGLPAVSLNGSTLRRFNTTAAATTAPAGTSVAIDTSGLGLGEVPAAIDWRPQTGQLLLFAVNATLNTGSLYVVDPQTGALTRIGGAGSATFVGADGLLPVDLPEVSAGYDIDVNPTADRVRVVTGTGLNFRLNPNAASGASVAVDGDDTATGTQTDPKQGPAGSTTFGLDVSGTAYTNSYGQPLTGGVTTQYGISAAKDQLQIQSPPNSGVQTQAFPLKVGGNALDVTAVRGFDVLSSVKVTESGKPVVGAGVAALRTGTAAGLYAINLSTGEAAKIGDLDPDTTSLAVGDGPEPLKVRTPSGGGTTTPPTGGGIQTPPGTTPKPVTPAKPGFGSSAKVSLKLRATKISSKGPAKITYKNGNAFSVKVKLTATTPKSGRRKAIRYASKSFTLSAKKSRTLSLKLPSAAKKVLGAKRKLTIKVSLKVTAPNGRSKTVTKTLTARKK
jgi:hypothetical protein